MPLRAREGFQSSCIHANGGTSLRKSLSGGCFASAPRGCDRSCSPAQAKWGLVVQRQLRSVARMPAIRPGPRALSSLRVLYTQGTYDCLQKTVSDRT